MSQIKKIDLLNIVIISKYLSNRSIITIINCDKIQLKSKNQLTTANDEKYFSSAHLSFFYTLIEV
jgi:hypothetical protein